MNVILIKRGDGGVSIMAPIAREYDLCAKREASRQASIAGLKKAIEEEVVTQTALLVRTKDFVEDKDLEAERNLLRQRAEAFISAAPAELDRLAGQSTPLWNYAASWEQDPLWIEREVAKWIENDRLSDDSFGFVSYEVVSEQQAVAEREAAIKQDPAIA